MSFEDWKTYKLKDVIGSFIDYRGKTPTKTLSGIPLITAKVVKAGRIETPDEFIAIDNYDGWMTRGFPELGDVVLTTEAPLGEVAQIATKDKIALAQRIITLRGRRNILDNTFLKYSLLTQKMQDRLQERATGTTVLGIKSSELREVEIEIPDLPTQQRIATILSAFDDKIALNWQSNQTLEEMARAVFREWFVNFNYPGADGAIVDGLPKGWRRAKLGELVNTVSETYSLSKKEKVIFLNTGDILDGKFLHQDYSDVKILPGQAKKSIRKNDILFSEIRPANKRFAFVDFDADEYVVSTKLMVLRSKGLNPLLLYFYLTGQEVLDKLQHLAESRSGTFPQITFGQIESLPMTLPSNEVLNQFVDLLESVYNKFAKNNAESRTLSILRDTLLPKFMKGEITL